MRPFQYQQVELLERQVLVEDVREVTEKDFEKTDGY